jgi:hypothetical protein
MIANCCFWQESWAYPPTICCQNEFRSNKSGRNFNPASDWRYSQHGVKNSLPSQIPARKIQFRDELRLGGFRLKRNFRIAGPMMFLRPGPVPAR